jgi:hypothetical protein
MRYSETELLEFLGTDKIVEKNGIIKGLFYVEAIKCEEGWDIVEPKELDPSLILPHPYNSLIYPRTDISILQEQIRESGWIKPVVINRKRQAVSGNSRLACARNLGLKSIPIEVVSFADQEAELTRLILENAGRIKTTEERVREAEVLASAQSWLKSQQVARQRKILEEVRFFLESRKDERVSQLTGRLDDDWKLCQKWGINELSLKPSQCVRQDDLLAEVTGMGSRENLRKATKVVQAIDLFVELGRRYEAELLRQTLNNSVHSAIFKLRELEGLEEAHYLYLGEKIQGSKGVLLPGDMCSPGTIKLKDQDSQAIVSDKTGESFFVKWTELELVGLGKNKPPKQPKPSLAPAVPVPAAIKTPNITKEPVLTSAFSVGEKVWLHYREKGAVIERVQWSELHRQWLYHFRYLDSDKVDSLLEDHIEPWTDGEPSDFDIGNWVTGHSSIGVVIDLEPIKIQWMGMGSDPAPRGDIQEGVEELKFFDFDPFDPPKQVLVGFKVGDVVSAKADKACLKRGTLVDRDDYGDWRIDWGTTQGQSWKDHQIHLAVNCGFAVRDVVSFQWDGDLFGGSIVSVFRCVADVLIGDRRARVPFEWLKKLPKFCHQDAIEYIEKYVSDKSHPSGILNLVVGFAPHGDKEALKHVRNVFENLGLPYCGVDSPYFGDMIAAFKAVLSQHEKPIDLFAIKDEQELISTLKGLSPKVLELSVVNLWRLAMGQH